MHGHSLQHTAAQTAPADPAQEIERLSALLEERKAELTSLQDGLREFKSRYTHIVGGPLAELADIERDIKAAEERRLGIDDSDGVTVTSEEDSDHAAPRASTSLRRLFWSVAKLFHPDHAADEGEASRRHSIMAQASVAYREGDADSLHALLGDDDLHFYCASARPDEDAEDLTARLFNLKEELRTVEFGIKRVRQDGLYRLKLKFEEDTTQGRDSLAQMAESIRRQIAKARHRLENLS